MRHYLLALAGLLAGLQAASAQQGGQVDPAASSVTVDRAQAVADGVEQVVVTVRVLRQNGQPYPGRQVVLVVSGCANLIVQPPHTDANGYCSGTVATTRAAVKTIQAAVRHGNQHLLLTAAPQVLFTSIAEVRLDSVSPRFAPREGGRAITLRGAGFFRPDAGVTTVRFGSNLATQVVALDDAKIRCVVPALSDPSPIVDVTLSNALGEFTVAQDFTYTTELLEEGFSSGVLNPQLESPFGFGAMVIGNGVIRDPGPAEADRSFVRTVRKDWITRDFVYELTLNVGPTIPDTAPIMYVGVGRAEPDLGFHREPKWTVGFRVASFEIGGEIKPGAYMEGGNWRSEALLGWQFGQGTRRVRIVKQGGVITFSFMTNWTGGPFVADMAWTFDDIVGGSPWLGEGSSQLYFGGGTSTSSFDDLVVAVLPPPIGLTSVEPRFALEAGGPLATLRGRGFASGGAPSVYFGEQPATSVQVLDDLTVRCVVPAADPLEAPFVDVRLVNTQGTYTLPHAFCYATELLSEDFSSGALPPWLEDPAGAFVIQGGVIKESNQTPDNLHRTYLRTVVGDFLQRDFVYELTVNVGPLYIAFPGIGSGNPDLTYFGEPAQSALFRLAAPEAAGGRIDVGVRDVGEGGFHAVGETWTLGARRLRILKLGSRTSFGHMDRWRRSGVFSEDAGFTFPDLGAAAPFLSPTTSRLFLGGAAPTFSFDDLVVATLRASPVRLSGLSAEEGPTTGGTEVLVLGEGFSTLGNAPLVRFGPNAATNVTVLDDHTLSCVTPAGSAGRVTVTARGAGGSGILLRSFSYRTP